MKLNVNLPSILLSAIFGGVIGFFGGPVFVLIPWACFAIFLGLINATKVSAVLNGFVYGFFISFVFLLSGYDGSSSIFSRLVPFAILAIFGAICGAVLGVVGYRFWHRKGDQPPVL